MTKMKQQEEVKDIHTLTKSLIFCACHGIFGLFLGRCNREKKQNKNRMRFEGRSGLGHGVSRTLPHVIHMNDIVY